MRIVTPILLSAIRAYQLLLSPVLGPRCRFLPGCSAYAAEAISTHGPVRGTWLAAKRIARCHPWGGSGYDPVPALDYKIDQGCCHAPHVIHTAKSGQ